MKCFLSVREKIHSQLQPKNSSIYFTIILKQMIENYFIETSDLLDQEFLMPMFGMVSLPLHAKNHR